MKTLIIGGSSLLGKYLLKTKPQEHNLYLTYHKNWQQAISDVTWYRLDVKNRSDIFEVFELVKPNLVIHCAAIGSVDYAETHYQEVLEVNARGVENVVDAANGYKAKVIYISTNAVYSGNNPPYDEKSSLEPVNAYGVIKKSAERIVQDIAKKWLIVRPFLLYGWPYSGGRGNWVTRIMDEGGYKLVDNHIWQPTYAGDMAETIWRLSTQDHEIYNVASPERATLYEFGLKICEVFDLEKNLLKPVSSDYFPGIAKRPKDTTYDLFKLSRRGIMLSDIKTGLEKMKAEEDEL